MYNYSTTLCLDIIYPGYNLHLFSVGQTFWYQRQAVQIIILHVSTSTSKNQTNQKSHFITWNHFKYIFVISVAHKGTEGRVILLLPTDPTLLFIDKSSHPKTQTNEVKIFLHSNEKRKKFWGKRYAFINSPSNLQQFAMLVLSYLVVF